MGQIPGTNVARSIDIQFVPLYRSHYRQLEIGHATCPDVVDLSDGKTSRCTMPIGGTNVPIIVTSGKTPGSYTFHTDGVVLPMRITEAFLTRNVLEQYGVRAVVSCGPPSVRVAAVGTRIDCRLQGAGLPPTIGFKVANLQGQIFVYALPNRTSNFAAELGPYLNKHRGGKTDIIPGHALDGALHTLLAANDFANPAATANGFTVHCPDPSNLTGNRHVECSVVVRQGTLSYDVWIDTTATLKATPKRSLDDTKRIGSVAKQYYQDKLAAAGMSHAVTVDCGPQRIVTITRATKISCSIDYGTGSRPLTISYPDYPVNNVLYFIPRR